MAAFGWITAQISFISGQTLDATETYAVVVVVVVVQLNFSRRAPGYFILIGDKAPHAIVVRVHVHKPDVVILTPERADLIWCLSNSPALSV